MEAQLRGTEYQWCEMSRLAVIGMCLVLLYMLGAFLWHLTCYSGQGQVRNLRMKCGVAHWVSSDAKPQAHQNWRSVSKGMMKK